MNDQKEAEPAQAPRTLKKRLIKGINETVIDSTSHGLPVCAFNKYDFIKSIYFFIKAYPWKHCKGSKVFCSILDISILRQYCVLCVHNNTLFSSV
jgi:hypothetical protein